MTSGNTSFDSNSHPTMTVYDFPVGPYPTRVRIAIAEKKLQSKIRFEMVDLYKGEHKKPDFIEQKNYSGTLPVLELPDGALIAECTAITQYLDTLDSSPILTGITPLEQGIIHMMSKRAEIELLDAISVYFHHGTPGLGPLVELYQNPEWGFRQRDKALRGMRYFDKALQQQPFIAGHKFSMADITVIGGLVFAAIVKLDVPPECEALLSWYERMKKRESVASQPAFAG
jgi:glutathione S-transferase